MESHKVLYFVIGCVGVIIVECIKNPVPTTWEEMCQATTDPEILRLYSGNVTSADPLVRIQCQVTGNAKVTWRLQTLREWLNDIRDVFIFLHVRCNNGGKLSLPWPMKANGLVGLKISNCILTDKYADVGNSDISLIPDQLKVLEIKNSMWISDGSSFDSITSPEGLANLTSDYDCGQHSSIEYMVTNNVSDFLPPEPELSTKPSGNEIKPKINNRLIVNTFPRKNREYISDFLETHFDFVFQENERKEFDLDISDTEDDIPALSRLIYSTLFNKNRGHDNKKTETAQEEFMKLLGKLQSLNLKCDYKKLRVLDESSTQLLPVHHFSLMVQGAAYPELKVMNYSRTGIRSLPEELREYRNYFPKLEYLDLSNNYLTEVRLPSKPKLANRKVMTFDVRNNLIKNIALKDITSWSQNPEVFVDVRNNPIHCACQMNPLLRKIQSGSFFVGNLRRYQYIRDLVCSSPPRLKGQKLSKVTLRCNMDSS